MLVFFLCFVSLYGYVYRQAVAGVRLTRERHRIFAGFTFVESSTTHVFFIIPQDGGEDGSTWLRQDNDDGIGEWEEYVSDDQHGGGDDDDDDDDDVSDEEREWEYEEDPAEAETVTPVVEVPEV